MEMPYLAMLTKEIFLKKILDPHPEVDSLHNEMGDSSDHTLQLHQVSGKSAPWFLCNPADRKQQKALSGSIQYLLSPEMTVLMSDRPQCAAGLYQRTSPGPLWISKNVKRAHNTGAASDVADSVYAPSLGGVMVDKGGAHPVRSFMLSAAVDSTLLITRCIYLHCVSELTSGGR